jgi:hypothetical protein
MQEKKRPVPNFGGNFAPQYPDILKTNKDEFGTTYVKRDADGKLECTCREFLQDYLCRHVVDYARSGKGSTEDYEAPVPLHRNTPDVDIGNADVEDEPEDVAQTGDSISQKLSQVYNKLKTSGKNDKAKELQLKVMKASNKADALSIINQYDNLEEDIYEEAIQNIKIYLLK